MVENVNASNVQDLLDEMKITKGRVAVEVNMSVIKRSEYANCALHDGDTIEIVNFVGGG